MKPIIKVSKAWMAALVFGIVLTGCGGGSGSQGADPQSGSQVSGTQSVDRSATLSWNAPSQRQDGTSLGVGDLQSYVISYGQDPENLESFRLEVEEGHQIPPMDYTFEDLSDGEWHFCVQAEDQNGLVSAPSEMVSKTIRS